MKKKRRSRKEITKALQEAEVKIAAGRGVEDVCKDLGISVPTLYLWRKKQDGGQAGQSKRIKELEQENALLKRLVAEQAMEVLRLKEALEEM